MDLFDSDDDTSSISSSSTMRSERPGMDDVQVHKDLMLDQSLDALYEKRLFLSLWVFLLILLCVFFCFILFEN